MAMLKLTPLKIFSLLLVVFSIACSKKGDNEFFQEGMYVGFSKHSYVVVTNPSAGTYYFTTDTVVYDTAYVERVNSDSIHFVGNHGLVGTYKMNEDQFYSTANGTHAWKTYQITNDSLIMSNYIGAPFEIGRSSYYFYGKRVE